jgi:hypothetical protein
MTTTSTPTSSVHRCHFLSTHRPMHCSPLFTRDPFALMSWPVREKRKRTKIGQGEHDYLAYAPFLGKAFISRRHGDSVVLPHVVSNAGPLRSLMSDANMRKQLIIHNSCKEHSKESRRKFRLKNIKARWPRDSKHFLIKNPETQTIFTSSDPLINSTDSATRISFLSA